MLLGNGAVTERLFQKKAYLGMGYGVIGIEFKRFFVVFNGFFEIPAQ
jgi:hypothetical protein